MELSIRDRRTIASLKDSWKYTELHLKLIIVGLFLIMLSLIGYGLRYIIEIGI